MQENGMASLATSLILAFVLSSCGAAAQTPTIDGVQADPVSTEEELALPSTIDLEYMEGEQIRAIPAALYAGEGYSIYIPETGWTKETARTRGISEDVWESTEDDEVEVAVVRYQEMSAAEAVQQFLEEQDDYVFQSLILEGSEAKEPLEGVDEDGNRMRFILRSGNQDIYIVSWNYRDAYDSAASQAEQIVRTFVLTTVGS